MLKMPLMPLTVIRQQSMYSMDVVLVHTIVSCTSFKVAVGYTVWAEVARF